MTSSLRLPCSPCSAIALASRPWRPISSTSILNPIWTLPTTKSPPQASKMDPFMALSPSSASSLVPWCRRIPGPFFSLSCNVFRANFESFSLNQYWCIGSEHVHDHWVFVLVGMEKVCRFGWFWENLSKLVFVATLLYWALCKVDVCVQYALMFVMCFEYDQPVKDDHCLAIRGG